MSAPMTLFSLDSRRAHYERSRRLLGKHFYAITGIRDWILSKRLQLQEITRVSPYSILSFFLSLSFEREGSKSAFYSANFRRKTRNATGASGDDANFNRYGAD